MGGFQFMHAEVFAAGAGQARPAKKGGKVVRTNERKLSAAQVVGEAARLAGCAPHVSEPVTPRTLYGLGPTSWNNGARISWPRLASRSMRRAASSEKTRPSSWGSWRAIRGHPMKSTPITCAGRP